MNRCHLCGAQENMAPSIHLLESDTNKTRPKSRQLSIELKKPAVLVLNKSAKSLETISGQLHVMRTTVFKHKWHNCVSGIMREKTTTSNHWWEKTGQDCQSSTKHLQKPSMQCIRRCWNSGVSTAHHHWQPLSKNTKSTLKFTADHMDIEKKPSRRKFCGQTEQKLNCLSSVSSNMFGFEKVMHSNPRTMHLLSNTEVGMLWGCFDASGIGGWKKVSGIRRRRISSKTFRKT